MSLPALYAVPQTPQQWNAWAFVHAVNHNDWIAAAQRRQQAPVVLATNSVTAAGDNTLHFASTSALAVGGTIYQMIIADQTDSAAIPSGTLLSGSNSTEVEMSSNAAGAGVGSGDDIAFTQANPSQLQQFLLDPIDLQNPGAWLYNHQVMHNQINAVLGTQGYDLLSYDLSDPDELQEFLRLNGTEHQRVSAALGVG